MGARTEPSPNKGHKMFCFGANLNSNSLCSRQAALCGQLGKFPAESNFSSPLSQSTTCVQLVMKVWPCSQEPLSLEFTSSNAQGEAMVITSPAKLIFSQPEEK